jgi:hypothetical protein
MFHDQISENCVRWEYDVKDFSDPEVFAEFRAAGFKLGI